VRSWAPTRMLLRRLLFTVLRRGIVGSATGGNLRSLLATYARRASSNR
jgi:hypothetical protein